jgi:hypothetical protein
MSQRTELAPLTRAEFASEEHIEALLDHALGATFPASDPVTLPLGGGLAVAATARPPARRELG